jgi:hypothetical protein
MNGCEEVREILVAVARGETVSPRGESFMREHARTCPGCQRRLENERLLSAGLAAVAGDTTGGPSPAVKAALMAEFRRRRVVTPMRRPALWWIAGVAAAAALLLAVFATRGRREQPAVPPVTTVQAATSAPPVTAPPVESIAPPPAPKRVARPVRVAAKPRPAPAGEPPEVATEFFIIPYAEPLRPEERADVFRIQVPRASMSAFGLPVGGGRLDARIQADVLAGEDGVARAIRFIR